MEEEYDPLIVKGSSTATRREERKTRVAGRRRMLSLDWFLILLLPLKNLMPLYTAAVDETADGAESDQLVPPKT